MCNAKHTMCDTIRKTQHNIYVTVDGTNIPFCVRMCIMLNTPCVTQYVIQNTTSLLQWVMHNTECTAHHRVLCIVVHILSEAPWVTQNTTFVSQCVMLNTPCVTEYATPQQFCRKGSYTTHRQLCIGSYKTPHQLYGGYYKAHQQVYSWLYRTYLQLFSAPDIFGVFCIAHSSIYGVLFGLCVIIHCAVVNHIFCDHQVLPAFRCIWCWMMGWWRSWVSLVRWGPILATAS